MAYNSLPRVPRGVNTANGTPKPNVLNPILYARLCHIYRSVRVSNEGSPFLATALPAISRNAPRLKIVNSGETYCICCPFCRDTKFRLCINHAYGQRDSLGRVMKFLAYCHNENCTADMQNRDLLWEELNGIHDVVQSARVRQAPLQASTTEPCVIKAPGPCTRLDRLPVGHHSRLYLESRGFDADQLAEQYRICHCSESRHYYARDRIVIPIWQEQKLRGWQARYIGDDIDFKGRDIPKYFTCPGMRKTEILFNWDQARQYKTLVICEGVFDVFSFGTMAVATFGASLSHTQHHMIEQYGRGNSGRSVVLLFDPDATEKTKRIVERLRQSLAGRFASVTLPPGTDPGGLDRDFLRGYVANEASKQNVRVSWVEV